MKQQTHMGRNRTGIQTSPFDIREMREGTEHTVPTSTGDKQALAELRQRYINESDTVGSVPVPGTFTGMLEAGKGLFTGRRPQVLIDKLGERLAFERNGVRLYEAMIAKARNLDSGNDLVGVLQHIRDEEFEHMMLVHAAMEKLGADPTAQTPSADVAGVMAMGIMQVLTDPRTNVAQCMNALLTAELADNAAWELLIELAQAAGHPNIADSFVHAKTQEDDHLVKIKTLMRRDLIMQTK